ncbi:MAG TPA: sugar ABC transporter substrate-binding protein [Candidatus Deferrimicrobium sp.]|nr:sugar ABC transporter substrate-binding protein [Candidatus Deferrimicrobium sp.]
MVGPSTSRGRVAAVVGSAMLVGSSLLTAAAPALAQEGPSGKITYAIWGDPAELANQIALVEAFEAKYPDIDVEVTVSDWDAYWTALQTSIAGGDAPDVFAMDGPLFPDYQSRDVLLDLAPYIERDGFDLTALADAGVAHFTTSDGGQYGLPRDLNVTALYYNKAMFEAAGLPYPDETWDWDKLVEVGTQLTLDADGNGQPEQWGFYTETTDMENYWSELVWQNGGEIISDDRSATLLGSDEAVGGLQFLQDLIWTHKIMPPADIVLQIGDAFEQGLAAMESNGSWLVPTHLAAGIDLGIAPLPAGQAGQATSVNPTGAVVSASSRNPEAAWAFVSWLVGPEAQEMLMQSKAALPVDKSVLEGSYSSAFPGSDVFAQALEYAHLKPSFRGYEEWTGALQEELDTQVFDIPNKTAREAIDTVLPALDEILANQAQ